MLQWSARCEERHCLHSDTARVQCGLPTCRARSASGGAPAMAAAGSSASGARALSEAAFASASSPVKLRSSSSRAAGFADHQDYYTTATPDNESMTALDRVPVSPSYSLNFACVAAGKSGFVTVDSKPCVSSVCR